MGPRVMTCEPPIRSSAWPSPRRLPTTNNGETSWLLRALLLIQKTRQRQVAGEKRSKKRAPHCRSDFQYEPSVADRSTYSPGRVDKETVWVSSEYMSENFSRTHDECRKQVKTTAFPQHERAYGYGGNMVLLANVTWVCAHQINLEKQCQNYQ